LFSSPGKGDINALPLCLGGGIGRRTRFRGERQKRAGSNPVLGTIFLSPNLHAGVAQLVEYDLPKVGVASSNLVARSKLSPKEDGPRLILG
jgi:hypothetical protein